MNQPAIDTAAESTEPKPSSSRIAGAASRFGAATMLSRVLGLVREQLFAALVGAGGVADAFVVAFRIPNLLRDLFAEGALSAAFVPTFTDYRKNRSPEEAWVLANRVMNTLAALLGVLVLVGMLFAEDLVGFVAARFPEERVALAATLTRIMLPFLPVVSLAAVAMGMLTAQNRFGAPALAPTMFNVVSIVIGLGLFFSGAEPVTAVTGWAVGTLLGGVAQLGIQLPSLWKSGWRYRLAIDVRLRDPGVRRIARLMLPATVGLAATQVNIVVNTWFASGVEGAPAWLAYAFRLMQLPIGVFGVAVAVVATAGVAQRAAARDMEGVNATVGTGLRLVAFLTVPATFALAALAEPVIRLIFERGRFHAGDTSQTALALAAYCVGLYAYAGVKVAAPVFYALDRARFPLIASVTAVAVNIVLNVVLFESTGQFWVLALGTSAAALFNFGVLLVGYRRAGGSLAGEKVWGHLARVVFASVLAAGAAWWIAGLLPHETLLQRLLETFLPLGVGALIYFGVCKALGVEETVTFVRMLRRRLAR